MTVVSFPSAVEQVIAEARSKLEEWPWDDGLGKPEGALYQDINQKLDPAPSPASEILKKASGLIDGERNVQHGDRKKCHTLIANLWSAFLGIKITPWQVALMMCLLKIARTMTGNYNGDCYVDLCGYGSLAGELAKDA